MNPIEKFVIILLVLGTLGGYFIHTVQQNATLKVEAKQAQLVEKVNTQIKTKKEEVKHATKDDDRPALIRGLCFYKWMSDPRDCPN